MEGERDFKIELSLIFILGLLLGITAKSEAVKSITIGFNDYKIEAAKQSYDVSSLQEKIIEEAENSQQPATQGE